MSHSLPKPADKTQTADDHAQAFENTSTNVAAAQMRNALTNLADTVKDPEQKKVSRASDDKALRWFCTHSSM